MPALFGLFLQQCMAIFVAKLPIVELKRKEKTVHYSTIGNCGVRPVVTFPAEVGSGPLIPGGLR
jgi:ribosomal protein S5